MTSPDISPDDAFAEALARCGLAQAEAVALAVSGGGDSMALAVLCARVLQPRGVRLRAYTVDHGLRSGSRAEAEAAGARLAALGIGHDILTWRGDKPQSHVQERARAARYALLSDACRRDGFDVLLTAHQAEDQMETFWMRLSRGSGLDGLAGMAPVRHLPDGLRLARPLLGFSRAALRAVCRAAGVDWTEDPSNGNRKYLRTRLRGFEEALAAEGLTPQRFSQVLRKLGDARAALEAAAGEAFASSVRLYPEGYARLDAAALAALPEDMQRRVLSRLLLFIAPADYPPGFDLLEALRRDIVRGGFAGRTAFGCDLSPDREKAVLVTREQAALPPPQPLTGAAEMVWDRRFRLSGLPVGADESAAVVAPLGTAGVSALRKEAAGDENILAALTRLPGKVRAGLPAVWLAEKLLSVPHLSWHAAEGGAAFAALRVSFPAPPVMAAPCDDCFDGG